MSSAGKSSTLEALIECWEIVMVVFVALILWFKEMKHCVPKASELPT